MENIDDGTPGGLRRCPSVNQGTRAGLRCLVLGYPSNAPSQVRYVMFYQVFYVINTLILLKCMFRHHLIGNRQVTDHSISAPYGVDNANEAILRSTNSARNLMQGQGAQQWPMPEPWRAIYWPPHTGGQGASYCSDARRVATVAGSAGGCR